MYKPKSLRLITAISYLIFISILFCLPGSAFPKSNWLSKIWFDKWVHIGLFFLLVICWNWALNSTKKQHHFIIILFAISYGMLVEIIQDQLIINRSFDIGDWIADFIGSIGGYGFWYKYIKK